MKRLVITAILILKVIFAYTDNTSRLARLHYDGGGDWYNDRDIIPNITNYLNEELNTAFSTQQEIVKASEMKINDHPFIFLTGHGNITFSNKEAENLRSYLQKGGFLYADDDYGMDESFRREIKKVFPDKDLVELPASHKLFNCYFQFDNGIPKIHKHDDKRPQAFAIFSDTGRMMVLYTYEANISDGWSNMHDDPQSVREKAFRMGANIFYYLLTQ